MAKVLVIDDDDLVRRAVARIVQTAGHETIEVGDGKAGMTALREHDPDLVITDVVMPEQEGIATIAAIREISGLPIIAISGFQRGGAFDPLLDAEMMGADITLSKPFTPDELRSAVEELLRLEG
jgi:DNA-binding response OmpR family regulator